MTIWTLFESTSESKGKSPSLAAARRGSWRLSARKTLGPKSCSDQLANSGLRVEATCMAEGQAAGVAAAIAAKRAMSVKDVPYAELCESLKEQGAIVPKGEEP